MDILEYEFGCFNHSLRDLTLNKKSRRQNYIDNEPLLNFIFNIKQ